MYLFAQQRGIVESAVPGDTFKNRVLTLSNDAASAFPTFFAVATRGTNVEGAVPADTFISFAIGG
jgi:hypothetical protein